MPLSVVPSQSRAAVACGGRTTISLLGTMLIFIGAFQSKCRSNNAACVALLVGQRLSSKRQPERFQHCPMLQSTSLVKVPLAGTSHLGVPVPFQVASLGQSLAVQADSGPCIQGGKPNAIGHRSWVCRNLDKVPAVVASVSLACVSLSRKVYYRDSPPFPFGLPGGFVWCFGVGF